MKTVRTISALAVVAITIILACSCTQRDRTRAYRAVQYPLHLSDTAARVAWFGSDGRLYRAERVAQ